GRGDGVSAGEAVEQDAQTKEVVEVPVRDINRGQVAVMQRNPIRKSLCLGRSPTTDFPGAVNTFTPSVSARRSSAAVTVIALCPFTVGGNGLSNAAPGGHPFHRPYRPAERSMVRPRSVFR